MEKIISFTILFILTLFGIYFFKGVIGKFFTLVFECIVSFLILVLVFSSPTFLSQRTVHINYFVISYAQIIIWLIFILFPMLGIFFISGKFLEKKKKIFIFVLGLVLVILSLFVQFTPSYLEIR